MECEIGIGQFAIVGLRLIQILFIKLFCLAVYKGIDALFELFVLGMQAVGCIKPTSIVRKKVMNGRFRFEYMCFYVNFVMSRVFIVS
jgi:hypothetical protein